MISMIGWKPSLATMSAAVNNALTCMAYKPGFSTPSRTPRVPSIGFTSDHACAASSKLLFLCAQFAQRLFTLERTNTWQKFVQEEDQGVAPSLEARSLLAIMQRSLWFALRAVPPMQLPLLRESRQESFDERQATDPAQETCVLFGRARYPRHQIGEPFQHLVGCPHWPSLTSCPCALHRPISRWCENPWSALQPANSTGPKHYLASRAVYRNSVALAHHC